MSQSPLKNRKRKSMIRKRKRLIESSLTLSTNVSKLGTLSKVAKETLSGMLTSQLKCIVLTIKKLREFVGVKEHVCTTAIERAKVWSGKGDWRQGKFAHYIARLKYDLNQATECIKALLSGSGQLAKVTMFVNNA